MKVFHALVAVILLCIFCRSAASRTKNSDIKRGFTNSTVNVVNKYFSLYYPNAIETCKKLYSTKTPFIYTTHPWLVSIYLDCKPIQKYWPQLWCPSEQEVSEFKNAAVNYDCITWHAMPFNAELELMDSSLLQYAMDLAHELDDQLGLPRKKVMCQRDVPGTTRSIIPYLIQKEVIGISVGVNGASSPPDVPSLFRWRHPQTKLEVLATFHKGGYGGIDTSDCAMYDEFPEALCFDDRGDNAGPANATQVQQTYIQLQKEFPNAVIKASHFDSFMSNLAADEDVVSKLPVVEKEIGDNWIYGVPSDPKKMSQLRELSQLRAECIAQKLCDSNDVRIDRFSRMLVKHAEHTWGTDVKVYLNDTTNWSNKDFQKVKNTFNFKYMVNVWLEQRQFVNIAHQLLENHPFAKQVQQVLERQVAPPSTSGYTKLSSIPTSYSNGRFVVGFDSTGAMNKLVDSKTNISWLHGKNSKIANVLYRTFNQDDFEQLFKVYFYCEVKDCEWAPKDFGKPGLNVTNPQRLNFTTTVQQIYHKSTDEVDSFLFALTMPTESIVFYGGAQSLWLQYDIPTLKSGEGINRIGVQLFVLGKTATRLPETYFLGFNAQPDAVQGSWLMDKIDEEYGLVDPLDVVRNGSFYQHGINKGIQFVPTNPATKTSMQVVSLDAPIVQPGDTFPLPTELDAIPNMANGYYFNLINNMWGTNYIMWYPFVAEDANSLFRFALEFRY